MDRTIPEEVRKRRLPPWMLGVASTDQVSKSQITEEEVCIVTEPNSKSRTARREKKVSLPQPVEESTSCLVKCKTTRRKREESGQDVINCDDNIQEIGVENKRKRVGVGRKVQDSLPRKKKKAKSFGFKSNDEIESPSPIEDDEDLTMEDLMSIAKEFVKDDYAVGQQQPSDGECQAESRYADTAIFRRETRSSPIAPQKNRSPTREETASHHYSTENVTSKVAIDKPSMTGDPTQDMLDLYLGPLLKKPFGNEKKVNLVSEDVTLAHEVKKQKQNVIVGNAPIRLTKKKSSLKDKVAMLLD